MENILLVLGALLVPAILVGSYFRKIHQKNSYKPPRQTDVGAMNDSPQTAPRIEKTALAKFGLGTLDGNAATIANAGTQRAAPMTIDDHVLRPTVGVRAISLGLSAALGFLLGFGDAGIFPAGGDVMKYLIAASVAYAVIFIQIYEVRYNRDRLIAPGRAFNRREHRWSDLRRVQDNGHYLYVLTFSDGSKLEVQKYLVGMADFLTFAQARMEENLSGETTKITPKRPGSPLFGSRKSFS